MELDLASRSSKFEKEAQKRREEARRKKLKEDAAQKLAEARQQEIEELARARKAAEEAAALEAEARHIEELRLTAGVDFQKQFTPILIESEDDKIVLPPSVLGDLEAQSALSHGPIFFRVHIPGQDRFTHCGVKEFSAEDGVIGVTPKILNSLTDDPTALHALVIKYVRLPRCTYARIRPSYNDFSQIGPIRDVLEQNLHHHSTITVGDKITVWHRGRPYETVVTELKPADSCSLINTDVIVDIDVSEEYQKFLEESGGEAPRAKINNTQQPQEELPEEATVSPIRGQARTIGGSNASVPMDVQAPAAAQLPVKQLADLPPEPADANPGTTIQCKVRLVNQDTVTRSFLRTDSVQALFDFVDAVLHQSNAARAGRYRLVTRFPRRNFTTGEIGQKSFIELGVDQPQESFIMEL